MDLADKLIAQKQAEERAKENNFAPHYGIDETGLPVPKPVNASYIVMRIIGNLNIYQLNGEFFVDKRRYKQTAQSLIALTGKPRLVVLEDVVENEEEKKRELSETMWRQVKNVINSEHGLIWEKLREMVPQFNKRYIRINNMLVWDRETCEILVMPDEYV